MPACRRNYFSSLFPLDAVSQHYMNLYIVACMYITVTFFKCVYIVNFSLIGIFSETDEPLDFNKPLVKGSLVNVISMNNNFFVEIIIKKLSAF